MNVTQAIRERRSIRSYTNDPVPEKDIQTILEAAMCAPSACNTRPWDFIVVRNEATRKALAAASPYARHATESPVVIVVCAKPETQAKMHAKFFPQDCGAAVQNILLQAHELGYGTCWCGVYPDRARGNAIARALGREDCKPFCLITLGVANESPDARGGYEDSRVSYID